MFMPRILVAGALMVFVSTAFAGEQTKIEKGACCLAGASCIEMEQTECLEAGGAFQGFGMSCASTSCGGACCFTSDGSCTYLTQFRCRTAGGVYQGAGVICGLADCSTDGACCTVAGACIITDGATCLINFNGTYEGDGTICTGLECDPGPETPVKGACCLAGGACVDQESAECADNGGEFLGDDSSCASSACVGACCFTASGNCAMRTRSRCRASGGIFQGSGTICAAGCDQLPGACCGGIVLGGPTCEVIGATNCASIDGAFQGSGTSCATSDCGSVAGACCFATGNCIEITEAACASEPGSTFLGVQTDCSGCDPCACDLNFDGIVDFGDLLQLISAWGPCAGPCPGDVSLDGAVGFDDLAQMLSEWGFCQPQEK